MLAQTIVGKSPKQNPDMLIIKVVYTLTYGVQGAGDFLNLAMQGSANANGLTDSAGETGYAGPFPPLPPLSPAGGGGGSLVHLGDFNMGGYYTEIKPGTTLQNFALQAYAPGGGELNSNQNYPAAMLAGYTLLGLILDQE